MKYTLPSLPYDFGALEPYIDAQTMEIHHDKHHQAYVNNLNAAIEKCPELESKSLIELMSSLKSVPEDVRTAVRNNGGGHYNHSMFWEIMKRNGGGQPNGKVGSEINKIFGSFGAFQDLFNTKAKGVFGSGWAWLSVDREGKLVVTSMPNQDVPLFDGLQPIMGLDVWEHAYYLQYQNKRPDYIGAWWHVINWDRVEENYRKVVGE